jgi:hypothetical protein
VEGLLCADEYPLVSLGRGTPLRLRIMTESWEFHQQLACKDCAVTLLLSADLLNGIFPDPSDSSNHSRAVGVVCPNCNVTSTYVLRQGSPGHNRRDRAVPGSVPYEARVLERSLRCEESTCSSVLHLFVLPKGSISEHQRAEILRTSKIGPDLRCPAGHAIRSMKSFALRAS